MNKTKLTHLQDRKEVLISIFMNTNNSKLQTFLLRDIRTLDSSIKQFIKQLNNSIKGEQLC
jgi:hypothetical protein